MYVIHWSMRIVIRTLDGLSKQIDCLEVEQAHQMALVKIITCDHILSIKMY